MFPKAGKQAFRFPTPIITPWLIVWFIVVHIGSPTVESLCDGIFFQETAALLTLVQISLKSARMTSYVSSFVATMV